MLPDGIYDAFIVDATQEDAAVLLELTILKGEHKGEVVTVRATHLDRDELDLIGLPATITVRDGTPSVAIED